MYITWLLDDETLESVEVRTAYEAFSTSTNFEATKVQNNWRFLPTSMFPTLDSAVEYFLLSHAPASGSIDTNDDEDSISLD